MPFQSGLSALIRCGAALELDSENQGGNMTTISIGCPRNSLTNNCGLEIAGKFLCYTVEIRGEAVIVSAALLDGTAEPEVLLRVQDADAGWELIFKFVSSLERHEVKSLERSIVFGTPGEPDAWVIA